MRGAVARQPRRCTHARRLCMHGPTPCMQGGAGRQPGRPAPPTCLNSIGPKPAYSPRATPSSCASRASAPPTPGAYPGCATRRMRAASSGHSAMSANNSATALAACAPGQAGAIRVAAAAAWWACGQAARTLPLPRSLPVKPMLMLTGEPVSGRWGVILPSHS